MGPVSISTGSEPTTAVVTMRARGRSPSVRTASPDATTTAAAPSTMPEAFPAWMTPSSWKLGRSAASDSRVVPGRGCSSSAKRRVVPSASFTGTGAISRLNQPAERAAMALLCEAAENSSSCPRERDHFRAMRSAEMPWWVRSGKRSASRGEVGPSPKPASDPIGIRVIDSTPPPMPSWICPREDALRDVRHRGEPAPAQAIHGLPRDGEGKPGGEHRAAGDVEGLLADLRDAAEDHVLHPFSGHPAPLERCAEHVGRQVDGVNSGQAPLPLPAGGPDCIDDEGLGHDAEDTTGLTRKSTGADRGRAVPGHSSQRASRATIRFIRPPYGGASHRAIGLPCCRITARSWLKVLNPARPW